ncbi:dienelactone hydrolase family protein [Paenibacillus senegalensis]|uniref:dienelactone hydrolase family protein n=1 Tax=Paenibacillus senegalensis TaxID=1465766 RepID=UPI00030F9C0C|nr:dienelactone hydrolase family protein [Paenibacillus senegalensis]
MAYPLAALTTTHWPSLTDGLKTISDWQKRKEQLLIIWKDYLGEIPERVALNYEILAETKEKDHWRLHLRYATGFDDWVTAYLLIPGTSMNPSGNYPAIIAMHPTSELGKGDVATPEGRANRLYGIELVSRGFVVLAPDMISAGERIYEGADAYQTAPFYKQFPASTAIGRMIHDHQQGLDLLAALPYVDSNRFGAVGHSLGAYNAFMLATMDERVKAIVSSCGLSSFAGDQDPNR